MIDGIVEPTAASGDAPRTRIAGVDTTAPPMPNMPDRTPVPTPTTALSTIRQRSDIGAEATLRFVANDVSLRGVYVPLITPFASDGSVALDALAALAHHLLDDGVAGLVPLGTTGETPLLDHDEQAAVIDACAGVCRERAVPMIVGVGTNNTATTVAAT